MVTIPQAQRIMSGVVVGALATACAAVLALTLLYLLKKAKA